MNTLLYTLIVVIVLLIVFWIGFMIYVNVAYPKVHQGYKFNTSAFIKQYPDVATLNDCGELSSGYPMYQYDPSTKVCQIVDQNMPLLVPDPTSVAVQTYPRTPFNTYKATPVYY